MNLYSTSNRALKATFREAVIQGLAPDNGLFMPERIPQLPEQFFREMKDMTFRGIAYEVASCLLEGAIPDKVLREIVDHTVSFDAPLIPVGDFYTQELFHGPTLAFKDFGARFMSRVLGHFAREQHQEIVILVATSGDTGSAVANGFLGVDGTRVVVLYPSGKVSDIQEKQFTTLGHNITAVEIDGTFDDCQRLVKQAFSDVELRNRYFLTSANSINIARLIPQSFYYFYAFAQLRGDDLPVVVSVPSGNFGNLTAGLLAARMGLPIERFIAATNANDIVPHYLRSASFEPRPSVSTISNAMDVGNPSNFARMLEVFEKDFDKMRARVTGYTFTDEETRKAMREVYDQTRYVLDPHGAVGYLGLKRFRSECVKPFHGIFLETAHPAKFREVVEATLEREVEIPLPLQRFLSLNKTTVTMGNTYDGFKTFLQGIL